MGVAAASVFILQQPSRSVSFGKDSGKRTSTTGKVPQLIHFDWVSQFVPLEKSVNQMDVYSPLNIVINGKAHAINVSNVDTLLTVLRDDLGVKSVREVRQRAVWQLHRATGW